MPKLSAKVLTLILAGGEGSRLEVLTEKRAKPVTPYAGMYRLIDFALSNCMHSGISDVWIVEQYQPHTLNEHLANGRPWDLDRTYGGLQVLPPYVSKDDEGGFARGNADAIYRHKTSIREFDPDLLLVLSADHVYKLNYAMVIDRHLELKAGVTMVTTRVPRKEASRFGTVTVNQRGRVTEFAYKPEKPKSNIVTTEVFVYDARLLLDTLDRLTDEKANTSKSKGGGGEGDEGAVLKDFGHELLPELVRDGQAHEYRFDGYWQDVGTIESYWHSHMDLLGAGTRGLMLNDPEWPILTYGVQQMPARIHHTAHITNSLISPGCTIHGRVERSILAPCVVIESGAVVRDSILLHNTVVKAGARVECAILDAEVRVGRKAVIGHRKRRPRSPSGAAPLSSDDIAMAGQKAKIAGGASVPAGARIKPGR